MLEQRLTACLLILGLYFLNSEEIFASPLLCIFDAELFPVFPHSCLSQRRNHKNSAKQNLPKELQFHLWSLQGSPASSKFKAASWASKFPSLPPKSSSSLVPPRPPGLCRIVHKNISADSTLAFKWSAVSFLMLQSVLNIHQIIIIVHLVPVYLVTDEVGDYCLIIAKEETKAKRLSSSRKVTSKTCNGWECGRLHQGLHSLGSDLTSVPFDCPSLVLQRAGGHCRASSPTL